MTIKSSKTINLIVFLIVLFFLILYYKIDDINKKAIKEDELHNVLEDYGITTQARIKECACSSRGNSCDITYQYEVVLSGQVTSLKGFDITFYQSNCRPGQVVTIKYLLQDPIKSRLERNESAPFFYRLYNAFVFVSLFMITLINIIIISDLFYAKNIKSNQVMAAVYPNPTGPFAWLVLGHLMESESDRAKADDCYLRTLKVNPLFPKVYQTLKTLGFEAVALTEVDVAEINIRPNWLTKALSSPPNQHIDFRLMGLIPILSALVLTWSDYFLAPQFDIFFLELLFSLLLLCTGLWFVAQIFRVLQVAFKSHEWPTTEAVIIGSHIKLYKWKQGKESKYRTSYNLYPVCLYKIKERHYYSSLPSLHLYDRPQNWPNSGVIAETSTESEIEKIKEYYAFGQVVTIYYRPDRPELVTDKQGLHPAMKMDVFRFAFIALFCWFLVYVFLFLY